APVRSSITTPAPSPGGSSSPARQAPVTVRKTPYASNARDRGSRFICHLRVISDQTRPDLSRKWDSTSLSGARSFREDFVSERVARADLSARAAIPGTAGGGAAARSVAP